MTRPIGATLLLAAALLAAPVGCAEPEREADRFLRRLDALPEHQGRSAAVFLGLTGWHARVLEEARRFWIEQGGRPDAARGPVRYTSGYPEGTRFTSVEFQTRGDGGGWSARCVRLRRVEVTEAVARTFPLEALSRAFEAHGRNPESAEWRRAQAALLPDPAATARTVEVWIDAADTRTCPSLNGFVGEARSLQAGGAAGATEGVQYALAAPADGASSQETAVTGGVGSPLAAWVARFEAGVLDCWRRESDGGRPYR